MERFIYVFTKKDRDNFVNAGLKVFQEDKKNNIFIFLTEDVINSNVSLDGVIYIYSNILTYS